MDHGLYLFSGSLMAFYLNKVPVSDEFLNSLMDLPEYPNLSNMIRVPAVKSISSIHIGPAKSIEIDYGWHPKYDVQEKRSK